MKGFDNILSFLSRHHDSLEEHCELLMREIAPEYVVHYKCIITNLMIRKKMFRLQHVCEVELDEVSRACHQNFMCLVMQLRVYGEIRGLKALTSFKHSFQKFVDMMEKDKLIKRLVDIGTELRHIEALLTCCEPDDVSPLKARFEHCVDDIQRAVGQANAVDVVSSLLLSTAYEPAIPPSI
jgi:hypothetical protein